MTYFHNFMHFLFCKSKNDVPIAKKICAVCGDGTIAECVTLISEVEILI